MENFTITMPIGNDVHHYEVMAHRLQDGITRVIDVICNGVVVMTCQSIAGKTPTIINYSTQLDNTIVGHLLNIISSNN